MTLTRRPWLLALPVAIALSLSACAAEQPLAAPEVPVPAQEIEEEAEEETLPSIPLLSPATHWTLTGVESDAIEQRPALVVKVENPAEARPQAGLEFADVVYEQVVEGGITRFAAVFNSRIPEQIYPVRSARPVDAGLAAPYHGILAFSGAMDIFLPLYPAVGIQIFTYDRGDAGFSRLSTRPAPHNVVLTPNSLIPLADSSRQIPPPQVMAFAPDAESASANSGRPAKLLSARMSSYQTANYSWDAQKGVFLRSDKDTPSKSTTGVRLTADNVIFLSVDMVNVPNVTDAAGSPIPEVILIGSGPAIFASNGHYIEGRWYKNFEAEPFNFTDLEGNEVFFAPGTTWVQLVPSGTGSWTIS